MTAKELHQKYPTLLNRFVVNRPLRLAHFFAQIHHESNLQPIEENLNYSAEALHRVFRKYFPTIEMANRYARKPEKIANKVYSNRMGNGNEDSGDGWKYRGRGFIQLTGKENYRALSQAMDVDYEKYPELLLNEADAMIAALWYWQSRHINSLADNDDIRGVTKRINGGYNGLDDRIRLLKEYKTIFLTSGK